VEGRDAAAMRVRRRGSVTTNLPSRSHPPPASGDSVNKTPPSRGLFLGPAITSAGHALWERGMRMSATSPGGDASFVQGSLDSVPEQFLGGVVPRGAKDCHRLCRAPGCGRRGSPPAPRFPADAVNEVRRIHIAPASKNWPTRADMA
jgi:hypothetical protein